MKRITRTLISVFFSLAIRICSYSIVACLYFLVTKERTADGKLVRLSGNSDNGRITLLALKPDHFHGDLDILSGTGEFRVLQIPFRWQSRLIHQFYPRSLEEKVAIHNPSPDNPLYRKKQHLRNYLTIFLPKLYSKLKIECVIGSLIEHEENLDWGEVSKEIGIPYVVLHRECLITSQKHKYKVRKVVKKINGNFNGTQMVVHNKACRQLYIDTGYVKAHQISSLGCIRMDEFVKRVRKHNNHKTQRKKVLFVPLFPIRKLLVEGDQVDLKFVHDVYKTLIDFADRHSEIDIIIKPKPKEHDLLNVLIGELGMQLKLDNISNLYIRSDVDMQELILESSVVCGRKSTVLLEAAIAGKPIVFPHFKEIQSPQYDYFNTYKDYFGIFHVAESIKDLETHITKCLEKPIVDERVMEERWAVFDKYVSSVDGSATKKYVELIKKVVLAQQSNE